MRAATVVPWRGDTVRCCGTDTFLLRFAPLGAFPTTAMGIVLTAMAPSGARCCVGLLTELLPSDNDALLVTVAVGGGTMAGREIVMAEGPPRALRFVVGWLPPLALLAATAGHKSDGGIDASACEAAGGSVVVHFSESIGGKKYAIPLLRFAVVVVFRLWSGGDCFSFVCVCVCVLPSWWCTVAHLRKL